MTQLQLSLPRSGERGYTSVEKAMGGFLVNLHVKHDSVETVQGALRKAEAGRAYVTEPQNGWISVYEERSCDQDATWIEKLTQQVSKSTKSHAISCLIHDGDFLVYWLYDKGKLIDQYNSLPDYFEECSDEERANWAGQPAKFHSACGADVSLAAVEKTFRKFAADPYEPERKLEELGGLLGIGSDRIFADFHGIGVDVQADDIDAKLFSASGEEEEPPEDEHAIGPKSPPFAKAIRKNDVKLVAALIEEGANINAALHMGHTPLGIATTHGAVETMKLLLQAGAKVNRRNAVGMTALYLTAKPEVAQVLVEAGADLNADCNSFGSPLHYFVSVRNLPMIRFLVGAGADLTTRDRAGRTPYEAAVFHAQRLQDLQAKSNFSPARMEELLGRVDPAMRERIEKQFQHENAGWEEILGLIRPGGTS